MKVKKQEIKRQDFIVMLLAFLTSSISWIANIGE